MATIASLTIEKERNWVQRALPIAAWVAGVLVILTLVAYLVVTSSGFIKRVILPRVSAAIHADVTVTDISVHPFRKITVRGLKVQAKGQEPVITALEARASYSLWSILRGNPRISEIALVSPTVNLIENPDGSSNWDALKASGKKPSESKPPRPGKSSKPSQIDLRKFTMSNATFRKIKNYPGGHYDSLEVANVNLTLAKVKNGQPGTLQLGAYVQREHNPPTGRAGHLQAVVNGSFNFTLSADLKPAPITGQTRLDVSRATGVFVDFSGFSAVLDCDVTPAQIKQALLHFRRGGTPLGELAVSGPLDMEKMEGRLKVELRGIDRRLLNLAGDAGGIDFGTTTISSSNDIELTKAGSVISATGRFDADRVQLTRAGQTTPTLNLNASYAVTVDGPAQTALLRGLNVAGTQNGNPLLSVRLTRPMNLAWGKGASGAGDSTLDLAVTDLRLGDWKPFLGNAAAAGNVGLTLKLSSQQGDRQLTFDLNSQINNFAVRIGSNQMVQASVSLHARGQAVNFNQFDLSEYRLLVLRQNQSLVTATGSGTYDLADGNADMQVALQASPAALCQAIPQPGMNFSSGTVELKGRVTRKQNTQTITGKLVLTNLTGQAGQNQFRNFGSTMDLDVSKTPEQIQFNKITGKLTQGGTAGGAFEIAGKYNTARESAQLTASLSDFNQNGLRPFLEPLLADKKLVSITVNGNASVQYDPKGNSAIKASMQVTNLVVNDPQRQPPATPLEARLEIDTAVKKQSADIHQFQITLTPTKRGQNQVHLQGQVDYSQTNAVRGNLKLTADSLDVTSYYDLFAGGPKGGGKQPPAATQTGSESTGAGQEPPAKNFPLKNFVVAADIGRFYLREIEINHWQTTVTVDGGHVTVKPFQLTLNGAPANATVDLNLGLPGYKYDLTLDANRVPVAPLVNTFMPDRKGQMGGTLTAQAKFSGAGITGAGLQRNLTGQFAGGVTNLNLSVMNVHSAILKTLINVIATIPQLLSNPESAIASLLGQVTGQGGGLMDELKKSPIQVINAQIKAGGGRIDLTSASVQSTAFKADGQGGIVLAQALTNSAINIPVAVFVSQPIAKQLNLASGNASANTAYVPLPQFLTMKGTISVPKADINKVALGGMAVKSISSGIIGTTTNGASQVGNLLKLLKKVK
ncbi:MAG: AsmA family protein [Verrucomicrobiota bacterium]|jgi:uncharacterized protein involved in outer membrane biogenesis